MPENDLRNQGDIEDYATHLQNLINTGNYTDQDSFDPKVERPLTYDRPGEIEAYKQAKATENGAGLMPGFGTFEKEKDARKQISDPKRVQTYDFVRDDAQTRQQISDQVGLEDPDAGTDLFPVSIEPDDTFMRLRPAIATAPVDTQHAGYVPDPQKPGRAEDS